MPDLLQQYVFDTIRQQDAGNLEAFADPAPPTDLGTALTQDEIDTLKTFINEIRFRYNGSGA